MEYKADNGGFGITIDDTFAVKDAADQFIVYTAKEGVLPQYQIIWSKTSSGGFSSVKTRSSGLAYASSCGAQCFYNCSTSLVGGNVTVWASSKTAYTYFRIDTAATPGYLTAA